MLARDPHRDREHPAAQARGRIEVGELAVDHQKYVLRGVVERSDRNTQAPQQAPHGLEVFPIDGVQGRGPMLHLDGNLTARDEGGSHVLDG
jgi:hypothetical protein